MEKINVVKITILPKAILRLNETPIKSSMLFFTEVMIGGSENIHILGGIVIVTMNS